MNISPGKLFESQCTGLYIGPDAVIGVTARDAFSKHSVVGVSSYFSQEPNVGPGLSEFHVDAVKKLLSIGEMSQRASDAPVQVAFDDRMVRFFVLPVSDKPDDEGVMRLLRWHADKALSGSAEYAYAARLLKSRDSYKVIGAAINKAVTGALEDIFDEFNCPWLVADTAIGFAWDHLDEDVKKSAAALIRFGKAGWTVVAWEDEGDISFIKTARWRIGVDVELRAHEGLLEAARLLAIYADENRSTEFSRIYVDAGSFELEPTQFAEVFSPEKVKLLRTNTLPRSVALPSDDYIAEFVTAYEASMTR